MQMVLYLGRHLRYHFPYNVPIYQIVDHIGRFIVAGQDEQFYDTVIVKVPLDGLSAVLNDQ